MQSFFIALVSGVTVAVITAYFGQKSLTRTLKFQYDQERWR
jgi:hypothetical protein